MFAKTFFDPAPLVRFLIYEQTDNGHYLTVLDETDISFSAIFRKGNIYVLTMERALIIYNCHFLIFLYISVG